MIKKPTLTPILIVIVGFLTVCPVVMLVVGSFSQGLGTFDGFTIDKYVAAYTDPEFAEIIANTFIFTVGAAVLATVLALFLAYMNNRTNIPFKFLFRIIYLLAARHDPGGSAPGPAHRLPDYRPGHERL